MTTPRPLTAESEQFLDDWAPITTQTTGQANDMEWEERNALADRLRAIEDAAHARAIAGVPGLVEAYNLVAADYHEAEVEAGWHSRSQTWDECEGSLCRSHRQYRDAALAATPPVGPLPGKRVEVSDG